MLAKGKGKKKPFVSRLLRLAEDKKKGVEDKFRGIYPFFLLNIIPSSSSADGYLVISL